MLRRTLAALVLLIPLVSFAAVTVNVNGTSHTIPQTNEKGWGNNVTAWIQAISANTLQPNGGAFTLTAETDFGPNYGLKSTYFKSRGLNLSSTGVLRMANGEGIGWRNGANSADLLLSVNSSGILTFGGVPLVSDSDFTTALALKANQTDLDATNAAVALKASQASLEEVMDDVALKATQVALDATNSAVALKASQASLDAHTGATTSVHGISDTANLLTTTNTKAVTNKDIDGGTASNTSRITLPKASKSTLDGLTRKQGTVVFASDENKAYVDNGTNLVPVGSASGGAGNLLSNGDFEDSTLAKDWTVHAGTPSLITSSLGGGSKGLRLTLSAVNGSILTQTVTPADPLTGLNLEHSLYLRTTQSNLQVCAMQGTTEVSCNSVPSDGKWNPVPVTLAAPSSGAVGVRLKSTSAVTGTVDVDDGFTGNALGRTIGTVSQATLYGTSSMTGAANCVYQTTSTSFANFAADTDCATPTVTGGVSAPATKIPGITLNNLPPGKYQVVALFNGQRVGTTDDVVGFRLSDGTTSSGGMINYTQVATNYIFPTNLDGTFEYSSTQSSVTIQIQGFTNNAANTAQITSPNSKYAIEFKVYRFPTAAETAYRNGQIPTNPTVQKFTASGSGTYTTPVGVKYIKVRMVGGGGGGGGSSTSAALNGGAGGAGGASTFGSLLTANGGSGSGAGGGGGGAGGSATITAPAIGTALAGAPGGGYANYGSGYAAPGSGANSALGGGGGGASAGPSAGSAGVSNTGGGGGGGSGPTTAGAAGSGGGAGGFVEAIINAPASSYSYTVGTGGSAGAAGASGAMGGAGGSGYIEVTEFYGTENAPLLIGSVTSNSSGQERVERATVSCSGSPVIVSQSGSWVSSIGAISSGSCTLTLAAGTFSATPTCVASLNSANSTVVYGMQAQPLSATSVKVTGTYSTTGPTVSDTSAPVSLICMGPR